MKTNDMNTAIYPHSAAYAKEHGELEQYRASNRANLQCKEAIEAAVREHFDGMYLSRDAAKDVIETYGIDRVMFVLANTVQLQDWDGRYSPRNKAWAKTIPNDNSDTVRYGYAVNSHPAVLDGFMPESWMSAGIRSTPSGWCRMPSSGRIGSSIRIRPIASDRVKGSLSGWGWPRLMVRLPCGSPSISSTFFPACASPIPRFAQVVVLPTPPFWLAIAMICVFIPITSSPKY